MVSAFISYAREDGAFVGHLVRALHEAGQQPRWDQDNRSIAFSAPWRAEIDTAIRESEKFVFVISPDSLGSPACLSELAIARSLQKHVIPVMFRRPGSDTDVEAGLRELNWIFFERPEQFAMGVRQLVEVLQTDLAWVRQHSRLAVRAEEWSATGDDRSRLLRGTDLRDAERWLEDEGAHPLTPPTPLQRRFVAESRRSADRGARRWRGALAAGLVVAVALAIFAWLQRNDARHQATVARARELAAQASANLGTDPQASLHLAASSVSVSASSAGTNVLRLAIAADLLRERIRPGAGANEVAAWSPTTDTIAAVGGDNRVQFWNVRTGKLLRTIGSMPSSDRITELRYSPNGRYLAAVAAHGRIELYDTRSGATINSTQANTLVQAHAEPTGFPPPVRGPNPDGMQAAWSANSAVLALYGSPLGALVLMSPTTSSATAVQTPAAVSALAFAPTGLDAVVLFDDTPTMSRAAVIADLAAGTTREIAPELTSKWNGLEHEVCWSPDGSQIATWDPSEAQDTVVRLFDAHTGKETYEQAPGVTTSAAACGATRGGPYVATGTNSGLTFLVRTSRSNGAAARTDTVRTIGHTGFVDAVATTADGSYLATASDDGTVRVVDALTGTQVSVGRAAGPIGQVGFSADGGIVMAVEKSGTIDVFDAGIGEPTVPLDAPSGGYTHAVGFVDGDRLVYGFHETAKLDGAGYPQLTGLEVLEWNAQTGAIAHRYALPTLPVLPQPKCASYLPPCVPNGYAAELSAIRVSADGRELAYAQPDALIVHDLVTGGTHSVSVPGGVSFVDFAADTHRVVAIGPQQLLVWNTDDGQRSTASAHGFPLDAQLSTDGTRLAEATADGATVWDVAALKPSATLAIPKPTGKDAVPPTQIRVAITHDGSTVALGDSNGVIRLWRPAQDRAYATRALVSARSDQTQYPTAEVRFGDDDTKLIAVNYPQIGAGDTVPPGAAFVLDVASGRVANMLASPGQFTPPYRPGVALSADGQFLLGGSEGFAPTTQVAGRDAVYELATGQKVLDVHGPVDATYARNDYELGTLGEWSADSTRLLVGTPGIFACDACADPARLRDIARLRQAWSVALTPAHDDPPSDNALF